MRSLKPPMPCVANQKPPVQAPSAKLTLPSPAQYTNPGFATASGLYFDNDSSQFVSPHADALDPGKCQSVVDDIEVGLARSVLRVEGFE